MPRPQPGVSRFTRHPPSPGAPPTAPPLHLAMLHHGLLARSCKTWKKTRLEDVTDELFISYTWRTENLIHWYQKGQKRFICYDVLLVMHNIFTKKVLVEGDLEHLMVVLRKWNFCAISAFSSGPGHFLGFVNCQEQKLFLVFAWCLENKYKD